MVKGDSAVAIRELRRLGIRVVMLTGDTPHTAQAIARQVGVDEVVAGVLPQGKEEAIRALRQQGQTAMVGDGINDAPALMRADVGVAIGAGTDVAVDSAAVVLMSGSLTGICRAVELSKATIRNIRQNLFWAFFYNSLGIPVAFSGLLSPMIGSAAMSLSSVFVVTNALRLRLFQPKCQGNCENIPDNAEILEVEEEKIMETIIKVEGMMCKHCKAMVEKVCKAVPGTVDAVQFI
jgi:Cu2+-exporting ATPase